MGQDLTTSESSVATELENKGRRKVVKGIVCGVTAFAAYHALPVRWGTPIIEQVFLPAHAATSAMVQGDFSGNLTINVTGGTQLEQRKNDFIADLGNSLSNFLVSEAQAFPATITQLWCVSIEGDTATWIGNTDAPSGRVTISGSATATLEVISGNEHYFLRLLDYTNDTIQVEVRLVYFDLTLVGSAWLSRSDGTCPAPAPDRA